MPKESAGLLVYRKRGGTIEVLLAHPGGPFWAKKDLGAWTIPKGLVEPGEEPLAAARREFAEETGWSADGNFLDLGRYRQPGGKIVHVFAAEGDFDPATLASNTFAMQWPPKSGRMQQFPEVDRAAWFSVEEAKRRILKGQAPALDRLAAKCAVDGGG